MSKELLSLFYRKFGYEKNTPLVYFEENWPENQKFRFMLPYQTKSIKSTFNQKLVHNTENIC